MIQESASNRSVNTHYEITKYNALKHGISSKVEVLPWESPDDLEILKQEFINDWNPQGALEQHLVLELAILAFRKQRLYQAENAAIMHNLSSIGDSYTLMNTTNLFCQAAEMKKMTLNTVKDALYPDKAQDVQDIDDCEKTIVICQKIRDDTDIRYDDALKILPEDLRVYWNTCLKERRVNQDDRGYERTIQSLKEFLQDHGIAYAQERINAIKAKEILKQQAIARAYLPNQNMERLQKYETTMNRDFERKLAMLVKLRDVKNGHALTIQA